MSWRQVRIKLSTNLEDSLSYRKATLYFLSGTGNTYRTAKWMADEALKCGSETKTVPIEQAAPDKEVGDGEDSLVGLLAPTHGFTAPWAMIRFAIRMPRRRKTHAFIIATRAGVKLFGIHFPGMEGTAGFLLALILALKGYRIRGVMGIDMPSNWTALHPGFSRPTAEDIVSRAKPWAVRFIQTILSGGTWFRRGGIVCLILGILLLKVSFMYLAIARFVLSKLFFASNKCNGCEVCAKNCPVGAIKMLGTKHPLPYWTFSCESCMRCMAYCPLSAIQAGHSWAAILGYITGIPASMYLMNSVLPICNWVKWLNNPCGLWLVQYSYLILSIYLSYLLMNTLVRIPAVNMIFTCTTLTSIYRRYHEPETKLTDLKNKRDA